MKLITRIILVVPFALSLGSVLRAESTTKDADNTVRNEADRHHDAVTPRDQGNSREDIDTTKRIRQSIVANKSLSTNAHNVKVITTSGHVTLRGPVESQEEKRAIEEIATGVATSANVDSQLEVKNAQK